VVRLDELSYVMAHGSHEAFHARRLCLCRHGLDSDFGVVEHRHMTTLPNKEERAPPLTATEFENRGSALSLFRSSTAIRAGSLGASPNISGLEAKFVYQNWR
jgi:hypothetical protein